MDIWVVYSCVFPPSSFRPHHFYHFFKLIYWKKCNEWCLKNESHQIISISVAQAIFNVVFFVVVEVFLGNNIDFWRFHNNSIFPLPLLIVFISPSHLPHKSLLTEGTSWLFESPQTKREAAIKSWGNSHILCQTFYCNKKKQQKNLRERDVDLCQAKDSQSKNPLGRSSTWTRVWSFAAAIIVIAPPSNQQKKEGVVEVVEWTVRREAPFSPLQSHGMV